tara:strand:- start:340 stop:585 length:246 start_codon:yes stop_codon:yes gene_type:complete
MSSDRENLNHLLSDLLLIEKVLNDLQKKAANFDFEAGNGVYISSGLLKNAIAHLKTDKVMVKLSEKEQETSRIFQDMLRSH